MGIYLKVRHFLARGLPRLEWCCRGLLTVVAWPAVVEEGTIVTAVADSSEKVGGPGTQFGTVERLARSNHHQPSPSSPGEFRSA